MIDALERHLGGVAQRMADDMKQRLTEGGHIDTGNLISSISTHTERTGDEVSAYVTIDAKSDDGTWYAEFLEYGSGIHREDGTGRQTPWRYKDRHGVWHTTRGQSPDPFIRPSYAAHLWEIESGIQAALGDLKRYMK